ncbi:MAG: hypothetical protein HY093_02145 [Candidatus Liptonbacteria bacterium]|nr:hypothetical protein [Candidatus Liptonbacteria bacterium]
MAIVVEEDKKGPSLMSIGIWVALIVVIGYATYYVFFKEPEVVDVFIPTDSAFENIGRLSKINRLDPDILKSPAFKSISNGSYITVPSAGRSGRVNPFSPF